MLKARKGSQDANSIPKPSEEEEITQKRYLILTHIQEFEKVHFPMPLGHLAEPDIGTLRRTFTRMQSQVSMMQQSNAFTEVAELNFKPNASMDDFMHLEQENESLRDQIEYAEREFSQTHGEFFN